MNRLSCGLLQVLVGNITRLTGLLLPLVSVLMYVISIIKWDSPFLSFSALVTWVVVCKCMGMLPALLMTSLLMYTLWGFVREKATKAAVDSMHHINNAMLSGYQREGSDTLWKQEEFHKQGEEVTGDPTLTLPCLVLCVYARC